MIHAISPFACRVYYDPLSEVSGSRTVVAMQMQERLLAAGFPAEVTAVPDKRLTGRSPLLVFDGAMLGT